MHRPEGRIPWGGAPVERSHIRGADPRELLQTYKGIGADLWVLM